tara:strand:- start:5727 stop:6305 length:579 start_codon:yes stop_codon:yes gene_type:complete
MARPRSYDPDTVLDALISQFWEKGFDATSTRDLVEATHLFKASLYGAFGDKRAMYRAALGRYIDREVEAAYAMLSEGNGVDAIDALFSRVVEEIRQGGGRWGCFLCNASSDVAPFNEVIAARVAEAFARFTEGFAHALSRTARYADSTTARQTKAASLMAHYVGMRVMARGGAGADVLQAIRDDALREVGDT